MSGSLILIDGPSSAGKTTLTRALQAKLPAPFLRFSPDFLLFDTDALPRTPEGKLRDWAVIRPQVFSGYHHCLKGLLDAGNHVIAEHVLESPGMWIELRNLLRGHDVLLVGLHCPLEELQRREQARGDRRAGDAERDLKTVHAFTPYHLELDCTAPLEANINRVLTAWTAPRSTASGS